MSDFQRVDFMGRLTRDPERKEVGQSVVCKFSIANNRTWKKSLGESGMGYYIDNRCITPELAWDVMLNGKYFHSDPEKQKFIDSLSPDQQALVRQKAYDYAGAVMRIVVYTRNIIRKAIEDGSLVL